MLRQVLEPARDLLGGFLRPLWVNPPDYLVTRNTDAKLPRLRPTYGARAVLLDRPQLVPHGNSGTGYFPGRLVQ